MCIAKDELKKDLIMTFENDVNDVWEKPKKCNSSFIPLPKTQK